MRKLILIGMLALTSPALAARVVLDTRMTHSQIELSPQQQARILREVRQYAGLPDCFQGWVGEEVHGSFTRSGAQETAYLVSVCPFGGGVESRLALYEKGRITRLINNIGSSIGNVGDINGDGVDDLLFLNGTWFSEGGFRQQASVVTLANGKFRTFIDFDEVALNTCGNPTMGTVNRAHRVTVQTGARPLFTDELYTARCGTGGKFRLLNTRRVLSDVR